MVDVLHRQVELVLVPLGVAAVFRSPVGEHPAELHLLRVEERHDPVVQQIGRGDRRLALVELGEGYLRVGVDEGLLVDPPHAGNGGEKVGHGSGGMSPRQAA